MPPADAIESRLLSLLRYLVQHRPGEGWSQFVTAGNSVAWAKVSIGGHSQGAGQAAYIGKTRRVFRVGMYAGPSDWVDASNAPPNWFRLSPSTPANAFFGFIHNPDFLANPVTSPTRVIDGWGASDLFAMSGMVADVSLGPGAYAGAQRFQSTACSAPASTALNQHNCPMLRGNETTWDVVSFP